MQKKKSKGKERPMPDTEARKETTESVKSKGESKAIKCDKCSHVMNLKNELTVGKKDGVKVSCVPCVFSYKKSDKDLNKEKTGGDMVVEPNEHLINVSLNRDISWYLQE